MKYTAKYSQIVMPDNINIIGTLFGGQMVSWMDLAAAKVTYRFLEGTAANGAVTRAIEKVEFKEPVYKGRQPLNRSERNTVSTHEKKRITGQMSTGSRYLP